MIGEEAADTHDSGATDAVLYANPQQPWSHVDATSIVLMRQLGHTEVFTADHHFEQLGFTVLL